jgi:hypothetical protein
MWRVPRACDGARPHFFGGSTHCLIFRPGVELEFDLYGQEPGLDSSNILVNAALARVTSGAVGDRMI